VVNEYESSMGKLANNKHEQDQSDKITEIKLNSDYLKGKIKNLDDEMGNMKKKLKFKSKKSIYSQNKIPQSSETQFFLL
jgi:hypothetical protein